MFALIRQTRRKPLAWTALLLALTLAVAMSLVAAGAWEAIRQQAAAVDDNYVNVDEGNLIYWVLTNCNGMDDLDDVKFMECLKTMHVVHANGDDGVSADAHTIEAPFEGTNTTIDMLKKKLYEDFQCFDASAVTSGDHTATAIRASYVPLDLQTDKFEAEVTRFIAEILRLAGIDDAPSYTRNQIINKTEETQALLLGAEYYSEEYITKKLLTINGDIDQYDAIAKAKAAEELDRGLGGLGDE